LSRSIKDKEHIGKWVFIFVIICYFAIAPFTSFAYDEAFYFQYFRWLYLYSVQPYYLWVFGAFYNAINVGSLGFNLPFYLLGLDNVIIQQFSTKLPFIMAAIITSLAINRTVSSLRTGDKIKLNPAVMFLLLPITIFDVAIFGNPLIIAIMFLSLSLLSLVKNRMYFASMFLGIAAATYLYPVFFILPLLKLVKYKKNRNSMLFAFLIFLLTLGIGQFLPVLISLLTSTPISSTVLAPLLDLNSSITVTSSLPSAWGPYYIIYATLHIEMSTHIIEYIYFLTMLLPVSVFLITRKEPTIERFINFLFLDSLMFVIFSITATPQYLLAIAPFAVYFYYLKNPSYFIQILSIVTFLDVLILFNNLPLLYFFSNVDPSLVYSYNYFRLDKLDILLLSLIYIIFLFFTLIYYFRNYLDSETTLSLIDKISKNKNRINKTNGVIRRGIVLLSIILIVTLVIVTPLISSAPNSMYFTKQADSESVSSSLGVSVKNVTTYNLDFAGNYNLLNTYTKENSKYFLSIPNYKLNSSCFAYRNVSFPNKNSTLFSVIINSTANPVIVGEPVTFVSHVYNGISPYQYAWYGGGNKETQNETSIFYSPGDWSVEVEVTDGNGQKIITNYTEVVKDDYNVEFNSHYLKGFIASNSYNVIINSSYIHNNNQVTFIGNFQKNKTVTLSLSMTCNVPDNVILNHTLYVLIGFISTSISICSFFYVFKKLRTKDL